jgi:hypothetical protein
MNNIWNLVGGITSMRIPLRTWAIALVISLSYGSFVIACPEWTRDLGLDVWNSFSEHARLEAHKRDARELDIVSERVKKRLEMKELLINELIHEQIDLSEATEQFQALNEAEPELATYVRMHFKGADDREKTARQVICFASTMLGRDPSQLEVVGQRLERQLQAMMGKQPVAAIH